MLCITNYNYLCAYTGTWENILQMNLLKQTIRRFSRALGFEITGYPGIKAVGFDSFEDMKRRTINQNPIVFDIGANIGQTVEKFKKLLPLSEIHSFEPGPETYKILTKNIKAYNKVIPNNIGLGRYAGTKIFQVNSSSDMSSFLNPSQHGWGNIVEQTLVNVATVDEYCEIKNINGIDILKSDTQGYDLEVLHGARNMIQQNRIYMIYIEINFIELYESAPPFYEVIEFLTKNNFKLVSFYKPQYREGRAAWTDALFINPGYSKIKDI